MFRRFSVVVVTVLAILFFANVVCQAQSQPFLTRHVPAVVANGQAALVGHLPANQVVRFDIVIPLRDEPGLDLFLQDLYNPSSPFYRLYITPEEFTQRFGPSQEDWDTLVAFAKASGFQIFSGSRDERDLRVTGTVASIEQAFHVSMNVYQHPTENRTFYSLDREPTADLPFPLMHVSGLDKYAKPHSMLQSKHEYAKAHGINPDAIPLATTGSGPSSSFLGSDMRAAYYCNGTCGSGALTGSGQTVGLFEYYGTDLADLTTYYKNVSQTEPFTPTLISTDGTSTSCVDSGRNGCDDTEQTLDMTQAMGMAPGMTMLYMYVGSTDTAIISAMVATTDAPLSKQIGCSWGWEDTNQSTDETYWKQMATQGQNFYAASGDDQTWCSTVDSKCYPFPADDDYVVAVGGTDLTTTGAAGPWASESAWTDSGGGIDPLHNAIPSWQQISGVITSSNKGSTTYRNGPDVAANANNTFYVCADQTTCTANDYGGTSFAAPMWAGYTALANQQAASNSELIGFINPIIYPQAALGGTTYSSLFHDSTSGSCGSTNSAVTGYDLCTGWGSPNQSGLINLFAPTGGLTSQTITCSTAPPASEVYNGSFTIACTASSGLAVTYTSSGGCSNSGATYTMTSGTTACTVDVNQAGNSTYSAAPQVPYTVSASLASQTITFTTNAPSSEAYNGTFTVAATASSGFAVAYTSSGGCSNSGATYTMTSGTTACTVKANQAGNTNYAAATQVTQTTNATAASQTITFSTNAPASAAYNSQFTVAATASSGLTVAYTSSGSCTNSGATYTMTSGTGTCSVIANQAGNTNYAAAPTVTQTTSATAASQTITFTTNPPASAAYNAQFTVAATATSGLAVAYTSSGSCSNSGATYTMTSGTGTCSVIANQAGSTNYSAAPTVTKTTSATPASQTITFTTNPPASAAYNSQFTVAATATSGLAVAYTSSGSCSNSGATYTMTSGTGTCSVIANQSGNTNYSAAAQITKSVTAAPASASVSVGSTLNPSSYGQAVSFTASVTGTSPTGTVQFTVDGSAFGSPVTLASGSAASGSVSTLTNGTHTVSATYSGDSNNSGSTGTLSGGQVVSAAGAGVSVASSLNPTTYGQSVTFTATISGANGLVRGRRPMAVSGTVAWSSNTGCGTTTVTTGNPGTATCTTTSLPVGTDTITANYSGDSNHNSSSGTVNQTVNQVSTSTSVGSSLNPSSYGQAVSFTASVTGSSPTGTVQFNVDGNAFGSPVTVASGSATSSSTSTLAQGTHTVTATYSGDTHNSGSTGTLSGGQIVNTAGAGVSVTSSLNPSTPGQSVTFTATISGANGLVKGRKPMDVSGTVAWSSNTGCGTTTVTTGNPGTATCTTTSLPVGSDTITANYSGDSNHNSSSGTLNQTVNQASATVSVGSTLNPSAYGQAVNFTASVTGTSPTGTVQFNVDGNLFDTETLVSGSAASISTSTLTQGTHTVTAVYSGDTNNAGSTGTLSGGQVVNAAGAGVSVGSSLNPSTSGQSVTFTATISGAYGLVKGRRPMDVSGTVAWSSNTGCGTTTVASGNPGTATCTTTSLPVGTDTITATYSGDSNHSGGTGTLSGGQVVNPSQTQTITFTTNAPSSAAYNSSFTVAATGGASGNPVVFTSAGACSNSGTTYTVTSGTGTCSVIANQAGNSQYAAAPTVTETVSATQLSQAIAFTTNAPSSATYNSSFTVAATGGASGNAVSFSSSGSCSNSGATYTVTSGTGNCSVIANQAGNANYSAASTVTQTTSATPASQTITVTTPAPPTATDKSSFTVVASAGTAITFGGSGSCTHNAGTYTINKTTGTCTVTLNAPASTNYLAAPTVTEQTQVETPIPPTVSFTGAPSGAAYQSSFTVVATTNASTTAAISASPATVCYIAGTTVTMLSGTGTCTLTATWAADDVYSSAKATQKTVAAKLPSGLAWATPAPITHGTVLSSTQLDATASVPGSFVYSPAAGTEPKVPVSPATCDTLKVTFTPTQSTDYAKQTTSVCLVVNP
ncbi:MAG: Ig-like domain repeat protein [Terriglobales bacterium]